MKKKKQPEKVTQGQLRSSISIGQVNSNEKIVPLRALFIEMVKQMISYYPQFSG